MAVEFASTVIWVGKILVCYLCAGVGVSILKTGWLNNGEITLIDKISGAFFLVGAIVFLFETI